MLKYLALLLTALIVGCSAPIDESKIPLSEAELAYIANRPPVTWAVEDNRPPYIFVEDRVVKGLSLEYIQLIEKKTGLKFKPVFLSSFGETLVAAKNGKVEVVTSVRPTLELSEYLNFTPPIAYNGGVYIFRASTLPRSPLVTAISKDGPVKAYLHTRFPEMKIIEVEDHEEAVALVQKGLADGAVMDLATAMYMSERSAVRMRYAIINFDYPYTIAYNKSDPILGAILTRAINSITPADKNKLNDHWFKEK